MKAIMVMFDSLNRRMLQPYGCKEICTPNFTRLAQKSAVFDTCYVGSMPCMPARRELHTGRYNFLHRAWGPLEPFDDSMPEILNRAGIHTHLVSDHYHYWEDGGATYHTRYTTWEAVRGREGDRWKGHVKPPVPPAVEGIYCEQDEVNRLYMQGEENLPQTKTFDLGLAFLEQNWKEDGWFLQIEEFDPHEPFFTSENYRALYPDDYKGPRFDWPPYGPVTQTAQQIQHARNAYAAVLSACDHSLGRVLDFMDEHDLWDDTMLIVNTDHGFLLGEHDVWAKCRHPFYDEVAHTPLFIWDPRVRCAGVRRSALVQTVDLAPTLLDFFGQPIPQHMRGAILTDTIERDAPVREAALFGIHGGQVCVTDGRYVYMRAPDTDVPYFNYTLVPCHMQGFFSDKELANACFVPPFSFTKGYPLLRTPACDEDEGEYQNPALRETMLFDLYTDPAQVAPIRDPIVEMKMVKLMVQLMREQDAPAELYRRLHLEEL